MFKATKYFTLIPAEINGDKLFYQHILKELFPQAPLDKVFTLPIESYNAILAYAFDYAVEKDVKPLIYQYLKELPKIKEHNKVILHFNLQAKGSFLLVAEGNALICALYYDTPDFGSALYYLLEILGKSQLNPKQTTARVHGILTSAEKALALKYLRGVEIC